MSIRGLGGDRGGVVAAKSPVVPVTFRKAATPGLPLKLPQAMVSPGPVRALPVPC